MSVAERGQKQTAGESSSTIISFCCEECGKVLKVPRASAGKKGKCPHCGEVTKVPGERRSAARNKKIERHRTAMQIKADIADAARAPTQVSLPSGNADGPPVRDRRGSQSDRRSTARVVLWEPKKRRRSRAIRGLNKLIKGKLQVAVMIVLLLVGAGVAALVQSGDDGMTDKRWRTSQYYYDLETGKLFVLPARQLMVPPFKREESGNTAVKAYVYACGKCDKKNSFIGFLEMYTARAKKATIDNDKLALKSLAVEGKTMLIGDPRSRQWYPDHSGPAKRLRDVAKRHGCSGAALLRCDP